MIDAAIIPGSPEGLRTACAFQCAAAVIYLHAAINRHNGVHAFGPVTRAHFYRAAIQDQIDAANCARIARVAMGIEEATE